MSKIHHQQLSTGRWEKMSFFEQMANVGSEVERSVNWKEKNENNFELAVERALELMDITINDQKNKKRLKELCRLREVFVDWRFDNNYKSSPQNWQSYFYPFITAQKTR